MLPILAHCLSCAFVCAANVDLLAAVETSDPALLRARQMVTRVKDAAEFFEAVITTFDRFWQCQFLGTRLSCIQASDIGAPSAENVDFVETHLRFCFFSDAKQSSVSRRYGCRRRPQFRKDVALLKKAYGRIK
jgi:hypothetical protein